MKTQGDKPRKIERKMEIKHKRIDNMHYSYIVTKNRTIVIGSTSDGTPADRARILAKHTFELLKAL